MFLNWISTGPLELCSDIGTDVSDLINGLEVLG